VKRDSIFFRLFQQSPTLLFELLPIVPDNADQYRFDSVAVKEPKFEIDGVFLPPDDRPGIVYYAEVQFQKVPNLYERLFSESSFHFYRNREKFTDWRAVVIYPSRKTEQPDTFPYRALLNSDQFYRVYLNELGEIRELPLGLALMALTIEKPKKAPETARYLLARSQTEIVDPQMNQAIIDMLTTIMVYRFNKLSRTEVEAMLGLTLQETRVYQEAKAEGKAEGEALGEVRGQAIGQLSLILLLIERKFGPMPDTLRDQISALPQERLEFLAMALLDFETMTELETWLE
jgi:predicted transposase/invertase (TIGR01784 family)